ncbi:MAG: thiamine pyrophosphate-binding protein [Magnetovibrio sp.]|nr:thiamine pyrophosphate-binding protein [Magnetovibrio sp.]
MTRAADIIAGKLYQAGCRQAYGIPGGEVLSLMDALQAAGIDFHLVKHENNGGFMAEGSHHASGAPGILLATVGPGVVNAINVVANAWQDQVPLIFLTGCIDGAEAHGFTHQVFDHTSVLAPITKASFTVHAGAVETIVEKALGIAMDGRPGPVHLDVPISVARGEETQNRSVSRATPAPMAPAPSAEWEATRAAFAGAERPLIIAGVDVLHHGAADAVARTARDFSIPVLTTYKAKGVLPEDDALALGGHGLSPKAWGIVKPLLDEADVIVLAGYDPIEMRAEWCDPWTIAEDGPTVIEFSAEANTHFVHQASHSFVGHVGAGLAALAEGAKPNGVWPGGEPARARAALAEAFPRDEAWGPAAVIDVARKVLPRDGVAAVDTGAHRILLAQQWECYGPRTLMQSTGLCTMGTALPLAAGHKLAKPDVPVIALAGDACMEMVLGELATLRDLGLAIPIVVFVDEALSLIEIKQRRDGMDNLGVDFGGTDFAGVAEAMGGVGVTVDNRADLEDALSAALAAETFTVIACPIGRKAYDGRF